MRKKSEKMKAPTRQPVITKPVAVIYLGPNISGISEVATADADTTVTATIRPLLPIKQQISVNTTRAVVSAAVKNGPKFAYPILMGSK